jgi:putative ABC transport system substrate-binding protein
VRNIAANYLVEAIVAVVESAFWSEAMRRRQFLLICGAAGLLPSAALSQPVVKKPALIAYLSGGTKASRVPLIAAFLQGMKDLGWTEGGSFSMEARYAEGAFDRIPDLARELLALNPDVFVISTTPANLAAKPLITEKPIVIVGVADPVAVGLVKSLSRPGGNITGVTNIIAELTGKRLEILKELVPNASKVAVFINPNDQNAALQMQNATDAAKRLRIELQPVLNVTSAGDVEPAFESAVRAGAAAAVRMLDPVETALRSLTIAMAAKHRLPTVYGFRETVEMGGLIAYGPSLPDQYRQAASFVDKVLKGKLPADLPVERPVTFELVVNLKTAKALGIEVPPTILAQATVVD